MPAQKTLHGFFAPAAPPAPPAAPPAAPPIAPPTTTTTVAGPMGSATAPITLSDDDEDNDEIEAKGPPAKRQCLNAPHPAEDKSRDPIDDDMQVKDDEKGEEEGSEGAEKEGAEEEGAEEEGAEEEGAEEEGAEEEGAEEEGAEEEEGEWIEEDDGEGDDDDEKEGENADDDEEDTKVATTTVLTRVSSTALVEHFATFLANVQSVRSNVHPDLLEWLVDPAAFAKEFAAVANMAFFNEVNDGEDLNKFQKAGKFVACAENKRLPGIYLKMMELLGKLWALYGGKANRSMAERMVGHKSRMQTGSSLLYKTARGAKTHKSFVVVCLPSDWDGQDAFKRATGSTGPWACADDYKASFLCVCEALCVARWAAFRGRASYDRPLRVWHGGKLPATVGLNSLPATSSDVKTWAAQRRRRDGSPPAAAATAAPLAATTTSAAAATTSAAATAPTTAVTATAPTAAVTATAPTAAVAAIAASAASASAATTAAATTAAAAKTSTTSTAAATAVIATPPPPPPAAVTVPVPASKATMEALLAGALLWKVFFCGNNGEKSKAGTTRPAVHQPLGRRNLEQLHLDTNVARLLDIANRDEQVTVAVRLRRRREGETGPGMVPLELAALFSGYMLEMKVLGAEWTTIRWTASRPVSRSMATVLLSIAMTLRLPMQPWLPGLASAPTSWYANSTGNHEADCSQIGMLQGLLGKPCLAGTISFYAEGPQLLNLYVPELRHAGETFLYVRADPWARSVSWIVRSRDGTSELPKREEWRSLDASSPTASKLLNSSRTFVGLPPLELPWQRPESDEEIVRQLLAGTFRAKINFLGVFHHKANIPAKLQRANEQLGFAPVRIDPVAKRGYVWDNSKKREERIPDSAKQWPEVIEKVITIMTRMEKGGESVAVASSSPFAS